MIREPFDLVKDYLNNLKYHIEQDLDNNKNEKLQHELVINIIKNIESIEERYFQNKREEFQNKMNKLRNET